VFQSTIANVFSGFGLQLDRTLRQGEWIEVGSQVGKILENRLALDPHPDQGRGHGLRAEQRARVKEVE